MSLEKIIKRASDMDLALGKRQAYLRVLVHVSNAQSAAADKNTKAAMNAVYNAVAAMQDEAVVEYEAAKAVGDES